MTTATRNTHVEPGYYLSTLSWHVQVVPQGGGTLTGPAGGKFLRIPAPVLFVVAPFVGLAFLLAMPVVGCGLLAYALVRRFTGHVAEQATSLAATIGPEAATGAAHLTGAEGQGGPAAAPTPGVEKLQREIDAKRAEEPAE
jgi:hypothetical protein